MSFFCFGSINIELIETCETHTRRRRRRRRRRRERVLCN
jgi:hypothetical protein